MQQEVIHIVNGEVLISSRDVARYFDKHHREILVAIDNIMKKDESTKKMFTKHIREYNGRDFRYFLMNRDGLLLLSLGMTGKKTMAKRIELLNMLNRENTKALLEQLKAANEEIARLKPKAELYDVIANLVTNSNLVVDRGCIILRRNIDG